MFEQVLVESGRFYGQNKKMKLCLLMLTVDAKKVAAIIFEKKYFLTTGTKISLISLQKALKINLYKNKTCLNNRLHFI